MTRRHHTALLWLGLALCAPVPFWLVQSGREPVAALVYKLVVVLGLIADEGGLGAARLVAWMLFGQAAFASLVLGLVAWLSVRALERALGERSGVATLTLLTVLLAFASVWPVYRTPFRTAGVASTLPQVFE